MTALLELVLWSNSKDLPHLLAKRLAPTLDCVTLSSMSCYTVCFKIIIPECREIVDAYECSSPLRNNVDQPRGLAYGQGTYLRWPPREVI